MVNADYRAEVAEEIAHPRQDVIAAITALGLAPGQRVLNVSCGGGPHLGLFARAVAPGGHVVGLDRAADRLALAAEQWAGALADGRVARGRSRRHSRRRWRVRRGLGVYGSPPRRAPTDALARVVRSGGSVAIFGGDTSGSFPVLPWPPAPELRLRMAEWEALTAGDDGTPPDHTAGYVGRRLPRLQPTARRSTRRARSRSGAGSPARSPTASATSSLRVIGHASRRFSTQIHLTTC